MRGLVLAYLKMPARVEMNRLRVLPANGSPGGDRGLSVSAMLELASGHEGFQSTIDLVLTDFSDGQVTELIDPELHAAQ